MLELQVGGRGTIPANAAAVVLNVTVTEPAAAGFITVWPCGAAMPTASNLNYAAGQTVPNSVISKVGVNGKVCVYNQTPTQLVADVNGYFPFGGSGFFGVVPQRLLDSRSPNATTDGGFSGIGVRPTGSVMELQVGGRGNIPFTAAAVVLNVTVTEPAAAGFITVWPCGAPMPNASNLNHTAGQTVPNLVISKVGGNGKVCVYNQTPTQLVADVNGYFPLVAQ